MTRLATPDSPRGLGGGERRAHRAAAARRHRDGAPDLADLDVRRRATSSGCSTPRTRPFAAAVAERGRRARRRDRRDRRAARARRPADLRRRRHVGRACGARRSRVRPDVRLAAGRGPRHRRRRRGRPRTTASAATTSSRALAVGPRTCVVGVSASGSTPFTLAALEAAREAGALLRRRRRASRDSAARGRRPSTRSPLVVGPGGRRRLDPAQGRNRAEARAQHDLDRDDDSSRPDVRRPDGRRRARATRSSANARAATSCSRAARRRQRSTRRSPRRTATRASRSSRSSPASTRTSARERLDGAGGSVRLALGGEGVRLGVEAALVRGELVPGDVEVEDGVDRRRRSRAAARAAASRCPGFVDLQVNGFGGVDFLARVDRGLRARRRGAPRRRASPRISRRSSPRRRPRCSTRCARCPRTARAPRVLGAHLEGPFLSPERLGTHPLEHRRDPDLALLDRLLDAGRVTEMTLAPELPGADALIERAARARRRRLGRPHERDRRAGATPPSTSASRRSRTSSTPCGRSARATRASPASRSRAATSSCR